VESRARCLVAWLAACLSAGLDLWQARVWLAGCLLVGLCLPVVVSEGVAHATPTTERYSAYEAATVALMLDKHGAELEPKPEGKRIVGIDVEVLDVIEERDPLPNFLNIFHANSRARVLERELLFVTGERWDGKLVSESERNLRGLRQVSLVIIVPLRTAEPDAVRALVIAKDVWSLRLNSDYVFRAGKLERLLLQPAEENLAGTHRRISGQFIYQPDSMAFGGRFVDPRVAGSRLVAVVDGNVIINQDSGDPEGSFGFFQYGLPLYSTRQKWSWGAVINWRQEVTRRHVGLDIATFDAEATPQDDLIPFVYDTETIAGRMSVTRSFGRDVKSDISLGAGADRSVYMTPDLSAFDPAAVQEFVDTSVPVSDTLNGPFIQYHFYLNRFASMVDIETMSLQESYLTGPELYLRFYPSLEAFGSTRDVFGYHAELAYTQALGTGYTRGYVSGTVESTADADLVYDSNVAGGLRVSSPSFTVGRLVYDGVMSHRLDNFSNSLTQLGGDTRLRGYPSGLFLGQNLLASNLEFRTRPFSVWTFQVGGALFYDVADVYDDVEELSMKQGAGFGLRFLFPQLGRAVMRIDWGFPLTPNAGATSVFDGLLVTFRQAFGVPRLTGTGVNISPR
jgi:hypothetical protein